MGSTDRARRGTPAWPSRRARSAPAGAVSCPRCLLRGRSFLPAPAWPPIEAPGRPHVPGPVEADQLSSVRSATVRQPCEREGWRRELAESVKGRGIERTAGQIP